MGRWGRWTERALSCRHDCLDTAEVERHVVEAAGVGGRGSVPSRIRSAVRATSRWKPTASAWLLKYIRCRLRAKLRKFIR